MNLKGQKITVGLSQINNSFSGANYLPYSVGLLQAYIKKHISVTYKDHHDLDSKIIAKLIKIKVKLIQKK